MTIPAVSSKSALAKVTASNLPLYKHEVLEGMKRLTYLPQHKIDFEEDTIKVINRGGDSIGGCFSIIFSKKKYSYFAIF